MKIDQTGDGVDGTYIPKGKSPKPQSDQTTVASSQADSVVINPLASQINAVSQSISPEPTFDVGKVDAIKKAIASGEFSSNSKNIADGLIASTRQFLVGGQ